MEGVVRRGYPEIHSHDNNKQKKPNKITKNKYPPPQKERKKKKAISKELTKQNKPNQTIQKRQKTQYRKIKD